MPNNRVLMSSYHPWCKEPQKNGISQGWKKNHDIFWKKVKDQIILSKSDFFLLLNQII